jgi:predicted outer membrane repeat protein
LPAAAFDHYEYSFSHAGGAGQTIEPIEAGGDEFELEAGAWVVTVKAYAEDGDTSLAATGSESFEVALGAETQVTVRLNPVTGEGTGTLNYALSYPAGATVNAFTLTLLGDTAEIDLKSAPSGNSIMGSKSPGSGYYLAAATLTMNGIQTTKTEVVHIYQNLATNLTLEFSDQDFKAIPVFSSAESGPGSLREAIANAPAGATIALDLPEGDRVIALKSALAITKNLTLYGGGATITQAGFTGSLVTVAGTVTINRIHFRGGRAPDNGTTANGGAIRASGTNLTLESCVFTDNHADGNGGAVYSSVLLQIRGSTFYGNSAVGSGGAVYGGAAVNLTGNIFYENTAGTNPAVREAGGLHTYNLTDSADWTPGNGDESATDLPISPLTFRPLGGGEALGMVASPGYALDFYGKPVPASGAAAGAAQTPTATGGFILDYAPVGSGQVALSGAVPDADGLVSGPVTLTAAANPEGAFKYWLVNGTEDPETSAALTLDISGHTTVRAVFFVNVSELGDNVPGSLRAAIEGAGEGSGISLTGGSFDLYGDLTINSSVIIDGNGSTLNLNGHRIVITGGATEVSISRLHFKGGRAVGATTATRYGGAIQNGGILVLESCIFSGNQTPDANSSGGGGALYSTGSLTVLGSTFYANSAGSSGKGGAIWASGTAVLQGNVFWENTASSDPVISGTVSSGGFNISDQAVAGLDHADDENSVTVLPFTTVSFKPFTGGAAAEAIGTRPAGYPTVDFYGESVPETDAAAGAVQETITPAGFVLDYAAQGPGEVEIISVNKPDADGLVSDVVKLKATPGTEGTFRHWTLDGVEQGTQTTPEEFELDVQAHRVVRAVFSGTWTVNSDADSGPGSLRATLAIVGDGDTIVLAGQTITLLNDPLPMITKDLTILGNGATLTQNGFTPTNTSQLLSFAQGVEASISRVHFTGGRVTTRGGAIWIDANGKLTLESCIFSDNRATTTAYGAIFAGQSSVLNIYGCTFYDNSASSSGGAFGCGAYVQATLVGNVFWGNTGTSHVSASTATTGSLNISDKDLGGALYTTISALPIHPGSFNPIVGAGADTAIDVLAIPSYPTQDFYGDAISSANAAAGAVQTTVTGYIVDHAADGTGEVEVTGGIVDVYGFTTGSSVTLTATPGDGMDFLYWTVNGIQLPDQVMPTELILSMNGNKVVRAAFIATWIVTRTDDNPSNPDPGSLRAALTAAMSSAENRKRIALPANGTITLNSPLAQITKSVIIEGNGATLTQSGFSPGATSQFFYINSNTAEVRISRLHFKNGRATNYGAAVRITGANVTLESCVFSDNHTEPANGTSNAMGGALYCTGNVTVLGCTFYDNSITTTGTAKGGAIYRANGALTLTGNIFAGNIATTSPVVFHASPGATTGGYNVTNMDSGFTDDATSTGWTFNLDPIDVKQDDVTFDGTFKPSSVTGLPDISPLPQDFPTTYFDGTPRGSSSTPGAMPRAQ